MTFKIEPGSDDHLTVLMAPHSLNLVVGEDRAALLAWGRDVWLSSRRQALEEDADLCKRNESGVTGEDSFSAGMRAMAKHLASAIRRDAEGK